MNPRAYPRGPRYRVSARPRPVDAPRRRKPWFAIAGGAVALVAVGIVLGVLLLPTFRPSTEGQESSGTAMDATRPRDLAPTPLALTPAPYPSPLPTATPRPIPTADPSMTTAEIASIIMFANSIMFLERRQRNLIRDYRYFDIDLLTRWIGESVAGAEDCWNGNAGCWLNTARSGRRTSKGRRRCLSSMWTRQRRVSRRSSGWSTRFGP